MPNSVGQEGGKLKRSAVTTQTDERDESHKTMRIPHFIPSSFTTLPPLLLSSTSGPPPYSTTSSYHARLPGGLAEADGTTNRGFD